ncbi:porin [Aquabacterium sp. J223]|uniref:porin n=1 Tax=Aquabacterium sp. J223 TaxID=2898431 RepID=UPI0021AE1E6E|nr:porin [Aquabacterium sp. J223]UUX95328.1 porin [Aquabacterium sp. J223]
MEKILNRNLLVIGTASAALLSFMPSLAMAQQGSASSVTIYGVMDAFVDVSRAGRGTVTRVGSGGGLGSRLGFMGREDLGGGLAAVFRIEQGLTLDDGQLGQGGRAWGREASVGLSSGALGTVQLGRLPTPYYGVLPGVDAFFWMGSGGLLSITRSGAATRQLSASGINARHDNAVGYSSPVFSGFQVRAMVSAGEASTAIGRGYSWSARYSSGPIDALAGWVRQEGAGNANGQADAWVVGGSYNFGAAKLYAGYTNDKNSCTTCTGALARVAGVSATGASHFKLMNLGVRVPVGAFTGIAQVVRVNDDTNYAVNPGDRDATWVALGAEYNFSRRTVAFASVGTIGNRNGSQYALGSGSVQQPAAFVAGNSRSTTATLGIRHNF